MNEAIEKTFEKLNAMSKEELLEKMEEHKDGDVAKMLDEIGFKFDYSSVAQLEEQFATNKRVAGSNPVGANKCSYKSIYKG